jgi:predicted alpha/beta-hydrolase family hydrolase
MLAFEGSMNLGARVKGFHAVMEHELSHKAKSPNPDAEIEVAAFGGRSMGARAAVIAATANFEAATTTPSITSLILVSYPLQSEKGDLRDKILLELPEKINVLFISGDGDSMCDLSKLRAVRGKMKARSWMVIVKSAGHGMDVKPKRGTEAVGDWEGSGGVVDGEERGYGPYGGD